MCVCILVFLLKKVWSVQKSIKFVVTAVVTFLRITKVLRKFWVKVRVNRILFLTSVWFRCEFVFFSGKWIIFKEFKKFLMNWIRFGEGVLRPKRSQGLASLENWPLAKSTSQLFISHFLSKFLDCDFEKKGHSLKKYSAKLCVRASFNRAFTPYFRRGNFLFFFVKWIKIHRWTALSTLVGEKSIIFWGLLQKSAAKISTKNEKAQFYAQIAWFAVPILQTDLCFLRFDGWRR